jgi:hypothetical protein
VILLPSADSIAALRLALYKKSENGVAMRLLSASVPNFSVEALKSLIDVVVMPAATNPTLSEWDRQEEESLLWQEKLVGKHYYTSYVLHTWDAVSALCSFEGLFPAFPDGDKHASGNWRGVGKTGELVVILPPVTITSRWELVCDVYVTMHQCTLSTQHCNALATSLCTATLRGTVLPSGATLCNLRVLFSTAAISRGEEAPMLLCAGHPSDLRPATADVRRWPHLPRYDDYLLYIHRKAQMSLKAWSESDPRMAASTLSTVFTGVERWTTDEPGLVSRSHGFQHPGLLKRSTGTRSTSSLRVNENALLRCNFTVCNRALHCTAVHYR